MPPLAGCPATRPRSEIEMIMCPRPPACRHGQKRGARRWLHESFPRRAHLEIHALVHAEGRPIDLVHGRTGPRRQARHSPLDVLQPDAILLVDRACDRDAIRSLAAQRRAWTNIPPKKNRTGGFSHSLRTHN